MINLGIDSQIQVSKYSAIFPASQIPVSHKHKRILCLNPLLPTLHLYIFSSRFVAQLGLKKGKHFLIFLTKIVFLGKQKACPIAFMSVQNPHCHL